LKRVHFRVGDAIRTQTGNEFVIQEVVEQHRLLTYVGENQQLSEAQASD
jgi:hypothetical protein